MNRLSPGMDPARSKKALASPNGSEMPGPAGMTVRAVLAPKRLLALGSLQPARLLLHRSVGADTSGAACATPEPMNSAATGAPRTTPAPPISAAVAAKGRTDFRPRRDPVPRSPRVVVWSCLLRLDIEIPPSIIWLSHASWRGWSSCCPPTSVGCHCVLLTVRCAGRPGRRPVAVQWCLTSSVEKYAKE